MDWPMETSDLLYVGGILLLTFAMLRRIRRRSQSDSAVESSVPPVNRISETNRSVSGISEARLYETFRELNARLETKIHVLDALIEESDRRIERLADLGILERSSETKAEAHAGSTRSPVTRS